MKVFDILSDDVREFVRGTRAAWKREKERKNTKYFYAKGKSKTTFSIDLLFVEEVSPTENSY